MEIESSPISPSERTSLFLVGSLFSCESLLFSVCFGELLLSHEARSLDSLKSNRLLFFSLPFLLFPLRHFPPLFPYISPFSLTLI